MLLVNIFEADYLKIMKKYRRAYILYVYLLNKLKLIYEKLPQEGIKNDLIMIYDNLIEISIKLNKIKQKQKFEQQLKASFGKSSSTQTFKASFHLPCLVKFINC